MDWKGWGTSNISTVEEKYPRSDEWRIKSFVKNVGHRTGQALLNESRYLLVTALKHLTSLPDTPSSHIRKN